MKAFSSVVIGNKDVYLLNKEFLSKENVALHS